MGSMDETTTAIADDHETAPHSPRTLEWPSNGGVDRMLSAVNHWASTGYEQLQLELIAARQCADDWHQIADARTAEIIELQRELDAANATIKQLVRGLHEASGMRRPKDEKPGGDIACHVQATTADGAGSSD
jgi:hypothetical protein